MKPSKRTAVLLLSLLAVLPVFPSTGPDGASFRSGVIAYEQGDLQSAAGHFEASLQSLETASARHNLALVHFRMDEVGEAAWQLERALVLEPLNAPYRAKLAALRQQLGLTGEATDWITVGTGLLPLNAWLFLASLAFWSALGLYALPRLAGKRAGFLVRMSMWFFVFACFLAAAASLQQHSLRKTGLFVSKGPAELLALPAQTAPVNGLARPAERARVIGSRDDFLEVKTESGSRGWIGPDAFRPLVDN